jgi:hypothetical protein
VANDQNKFEVEISGNLDGLNKAINEGKGELKGLSNEAKSGGGVFKSLSGVFAGFNANLGGANVNLARLPLHKRAWTASTRLWFR